MLRANRKWLLGTLVLVVAASAAWQGQRYFIKKKSGQENPSTNEVTELQGQRFDEARAKGQVFSRSYPETDKYPIDPWEAPKVKVKDRKSDSTYDSYPSHSLNTLGGHSNEMKEPELAKNSFSMGGQLNDLPPLPSEDYGDFTSNIDSGNILSSSYDSGNTSTGNFFDYMDETPPPSDLPPPPYDEQVTSYNDGSSQGNLGYDSYDSFEQDPGLYDDYQAEYVPYDSGFADNARFSEENVEGKENKNKGKENDSRGKRMAGLASGSSGANVVTEQAQGESSDQEETNKSKSNDNGHSLTMNFGRTQRTELSGTPVPTPKKDEALTTAKNLEEVLDEISELSKANIHFGLKLAAIQIESLQSVLEMFKNGALKGKKIKQIYLTSFNYFNPQSEELYVDCAPEYSEFSVDLGQEMSVDLNVLLTEESKKLQESLGLTIQVSTSSPPAGVLVSLYCFESLLVKSAIGSESVKTIEFSSQTAFDESAKVLELAPYERIDTLENFLKQKGILIPAK